MLHYTLDATVAPYPDEISPDCSYPLMHMTRLTIAEDPGEEFALRAHNIVTDWYDDEVVFYNDVLKVHVLSERESFTVQIITPDFVVEMDFPDAVNVRNALELFEAKRVLEVDSQVANSVRLVPTSSEGPPPKAESNIG